MSESKRKNLVVTSSQSGSGSVTGYQDGERNWSRVWGASDASRLMKEGTEEQASSPV